MKLIELQQLAQHDFDLDIRSKSDATDNELYSGYHEIITGEPLDDEHRSRFEKALVGLIGSNAAHVGLLNELNFTSVEPADATMIMDKELIPSEEIQDKIAAIRSVIDECQELYAEQLEGETLVATGEDARQRLARYVIASILFDDRDDEDA